MAIDLRRTDSPERSKSSTSHGRVLLRWFQQAPSLVYLLGGAFLAYQYWKRLHRPVFLVIGVLFMLYGICRILLVSRSARHL